LPTPSLREGISEDQITPGLWGFIMTAFFVLATTLLIVDMVRRIRRVRYRGQVEEERQAAAEAAVIEADDVRHPVEDDIQSLAEDGPDTSQRGPKD
jgi:flagellar biosynthesis/type III secretory pathway M-ring protein FliF/YscJ